jgi:hypothetical protein
MQVERPTKQSISRVCDCEQPYCDGSIGDALFSEKVCAWTKPEN